MTMFEMKISTAGSAFDEPGAELARILRAVADNVEASAIPSHTVVMDSNGSTVGSFTLNAS